MRPPFHALPAASLARLRVLSERPPILTAPDLLSSDECALLLQKAQRGATPLRRQSFDAPDGSHGERTSTGCVVRNDEVPTLRARFAALAGVHQSQLQPLKLSRYGRDERFDMHTDAIRGDLRGEAPSPDDWWADGPRGKHGVPGAPFTGCNRILTIFVYLRSVARGGRTRWRWTEHDEAVGGSVGSSWYDAPRPGSGRTDVLRGSGTEVSASSALSESAAIGSPNRLMR